jgi:hypothetical protein
MKLEKNLAKNENEKSFAKNGKNFFQKMKCEIF